MRVVREEAHLLRSAHPPALAALAVKAALECISNNANAKVVGQVQEECASRLLAMRTLCPPPLRRLGEEIVLTKPLELLPLFTLATLKLPVLASAALVRERYEPDVVADGVHKLLRLPAHLVCNALFPRVHVLHLSNEGDGWIPAEVQAVGHGASLAQVADASRAADSDNAEVPATGADKTCGKDSGGIPAPPSTRELPMARSSDISPMGVYLLDGVLDLTIWIGAQASPTFLRALFGDAAPVDNATLLSADSSAEAQKLHALIAASRDNHPDPPPLRVLVQGSPASPYFFSRLVGEGYEQFALALHEGRVRPKL